MAQSPIATRPSGKTNFERFVHSKNASSSMWVIVLGSITWLILLQAEKASLWMYLTLFAIL